MVGRGGKHLGHFSDALAAAEMTASARVRGMEQVRQGRLCEGGQGWASQRGKSQCQNALLDALATAKMTASARMRGMEQVERGPRNGGGWLEVEGWGRRDTGAGAGLLGWSCRDGAMRGYEGGLRSKFSSSLQAIGASWSERCYFARHPER